MSLCRKTAEKNKNKNKVRVITLQEAEKAKISDQILQNEDQSSLRLSPKTESIWRL